MTIVTRSQLAKAILKHTREISEHRDALRELISDAEEIENDSSDAIDCLEQAVEFLSRNL